MREEICFGGRLKTHLQGNGAERSWVSSFNSKQLRFHLWAGGLRTHVKCVLELPSTGERNPSICPPASILHGWRAASGYPHPESCNLPYQAVYLQGDRSRFDIVWLISMLKGTQACTLSPSPQKLMAHFSQMKL